MTVQVPVPLVIVKSAPMFVHDPNEVYVTDKFDEAVASTVKVEPLIALNGACVLTVIFWSTVVGGADCASYAPISHPVSNGRTSPR